MKRIMVVLLAVGVVGAVPACWAGGGLGVYGSYLDSEDPGTALGGGAKVKLDLAEVLAMELRGSYLTRFEAEEEGAKVRFDDLALIPLEADLVFTLPLGEGAASLYGGGGGGYYIIPEYDLVEYAGPGGTHQYDLEDTFGFFAVGGIEVNLGEAVALFAEVQYRWMEVDSAEVDGTAVDFADEFIAEFTGPCGNAGLMFRW